MEVAAPHQLEVAHEADLLVGDHDVQGEEGQDLSPEGTVLLGECLDLGEEGEEYFLPGGFLGDKGEVFEHPGNDLF